ncbi:MAG: hypothetical protein WD005_03290, partial [Haliea sp.]
NRRPRDSLHRVRMVKVHVPESRTEHLIGNRVELFIEVRVQREGRVYIQLRSRCVGVDLSVPSTSRQ